MTHPSHPCCGLVNVIDSLCLCQVWDQILFRLQTIFEKPKLSLRCFHEVPLDNGGSSSRTFHFTSTFTFITVHRFRSTIYSFFVDKNILLYYIT